MRKLLSFMLVLVLVLTPLVSNAAPSSSFITTPPTGYDSADDVRYVTASVSGRTVITNWGARGETCVFLTRYVDSYYTDSYNTMAGWTGGTSTSNVTSSQMYKELKELMTDSHEFYTYYDGNKNVRNFYKYTDCVSNDTSKVALIYRGGLVSSAWDGGNTWNQEHCAPQSILNKVSQPTGDIMHLRPSNPSENSSRGNKTYGTKSGNYDPGISVRGDCARMMLYMHVRWGTNLTSLIESVDLMLQWMKDDPVDTWEMARNDSVQSITGVRNVFVDYPELAFLMFSKSVPQDMTTPSGYAKNGTGSTTPTPCQHTSTEVRGWKGATCTAGGYTGDTYCKSCGVKIATGSTTSIVNHKDNNGDGLCDSCGLRLNCNHAKQEERNKKSVTCTENGYTGDTYCLDCGDKLTTGTVITATGHKDLDGNGECDACGNRSDCKHAHVEIRNRVSADCTTAGYTGDQYCTDCQTIIANGKTFPEVHIDGDRNFVCDACGATITPPATEPTEAPTKPTVPAEPSAPTDNSPAGQNNNQPIIWIVVGIIAATIILAIVIIVVKKAKNE
jgi:endonuclease I